MKLYNFQEKIVNDIKTALRQGHKAILVCAPCGAGKSYIMKYILENLKPGLKSIVICHRKELKAQHTELMPNQRIELPITAYNMLKRNEIGDEDVSIHDEVHLALAETWNALLEHYKKSNKIIIGFSATPERLDGKSFGNLFTKIVNAPSVKWLIDHDFLSKFKYYCPQVPNCDKLSSEARLRPESHLSEYEELYRKRGVLGKVVDTYKKLADNKKVIVYCINKIHAKRVAEEFTANKITAYSIDSDDTKEDRVNILEQFRNNEFKVLCNCGLLSEGISILDLDAVILLRPTSSYALFVQQSMRPLRKYGDKTAKVIDMVNNYARHGLPDDEHEFTLDISKRERKKEFDDEGNFNIRYCQTCFQAFKCRPVCPHCGAVYELQKREIEEHKNIEIAEIKEAQKTQKKITKKNFDKELHYCSNEHDAAILASRYGYNPYYGIIRFKNRRSRKG